jgi:hypothetical protein
MGVSQVRIEKPRPRAGLFVLRDYSSGKREPAADMKINVYNEELTDRVELQKVSAKTGAPFYGLSFYLASPDVLHNTPGDDDSSAVVFWSDSREKLVALLSSALKQIDNYLEPKQTT